MVSEDRHRMLLVAGKLAVCGHDCPAVIKLAHIARSQVYHRLDGKNHARLNARVRTRNWQIRNGRILVNVKAYAVTAEIVDNAVTGGFGDSGDCF